MQAKLVDQDSLTRNYMKLYFSSYSPIDCLILSVFGKESMNICLLIVNIIVQFVDEDLKEKMLF